MTRWLRFAGSGRDGGVRRAWDFTMRVIVSVPGHAASGDKKKTSFLVRTGTKVPKREVALRRPNETPFFGMAQVQTVGGSVQGGLMGSEHRRLRVGGSVVW